MLRKLFLYALMMPLIRVTPLYASEQAALGSASCKSATPAHFVFSGAASRIVNLKPWSQTGCTNPGGIVPRALIGLCTGDQCRFDARGADGFLLPGQWNEVSKAGIARKLGGVAPVPPDDSGSAMRFVTTDGQWQIPLLRQAADTSGSHESSAFWFTGVCEGLLCSFHASPNADLPVIWDFGDGTVITGNTPAVVHQFSRDGRSTVSAMDAQGKPASVTATIRNAAPQADFSVRCAARICTYDGASSRDIDGQIDQWTWSFADGTQLDGAVVVRQQSQTESVKLRVTDELGLSVRIEKSVAPGTQQAFGKPASFSGAWFNPSLDGSGINILRRDDDPVTAQDERALVVYYYGYLDDGSGLMWLISNPLFGAESELTPGTGTTLEMLKGNGGSLNSPAPVSLTNPWGTLNLKFDSCSSGVMELHSNATEGDIETTSIQKLVGIGGLDDCGEGGAPPVVALNVDCPNLMCSFTANTTVATGRSVEFYNWLFGDGVTLQGDASLNSVSHTYTDDSQDFQATVIVTDSVGDATRVTRTITDLVNAPPNAVLNFGVCHQVPSSGKIRCDFDALGSTDPDGDSAALLFQWNFGDGNGLTGGKTTNITFTHDYDTPTSYEVTLNVRDALGALTSVTKTLDANETPVASFTDTCNINGNPLKCHFDPADSHDDGSIVRYSWDFGDQSPIVAGGSSTAQNHTFPAPGPYTVTLTVTDDSGKTNTQQTPLTLAVGAAPVADFSFSCDATTFACSFTSTSTDVEDGSLSNFQWDFGDGEMGAGSPAPHTYPDGSPRTVKLTVTDSDQNSSTVSKSLDPTNTNNDPTVSILMNSCTTVDVACAMEANGNDLDQDPLKFSWDFGDGTPATAFSSSNRGDHTYTQAGSRIATVTVDDGHGGMGTANTNVTIQDPSNPVSVDFTWDCPSSGLTCTKFDALENGGAITQLTWNWGHNNASTTGPWPLFDNQSHAFPSANSYQVTLTIQTGNGPAQKTKTVVVGGGGSGTPPGGGSNSPPSVSIFAITCNINADPLLCQFSGNASDPDQDPLTLTWNFGDSTPLVSGGAEKLTMTHRYSAAGTYAVIFTATDNKSTPVSANGQAVAQQTGAPIAQFIVTGCNSQLNCGFDGSASGDTDGGFITSYKWQYGDSSQPQSGSALTQPSHAYSMAGSYNVTLTVTDNDGKTNFVTHPVTAVGQTPLARFGFSCANLQCTFDANTSLTANPPLTTYQWTFTNSAGGTPVMVTSSSAVLSHAFPSAGTYSVALLVTDQVATSDPADSMSVQSVIVTTGNTGIPSTNPYDSRIAGDPYASFTWCRNGMTVNFTDTSMASIPDSAGNIIRANAGNTFAWTFDSALGAATGTGAAPVHAYTVGGAHEVTLTVTTADLQRTSTMKRVVTVASGIAACDDLTNVNDTTLVYSPPINPPSWCSEVDAVTTQPKVTLPPVASFTRSTDVDPPIVLGAGAGDHTRYLWFSDVGGADGQSHDYSLDDNKYMAAAFVVNPRFLSVADPAGGQQWAIIIKQPDFGVVSTIERLSRGALGAQFVSISQCPGDFAGQNQGHIDGANNSNANCTTPSPQGKPTMKWNLPGAAQQQGRCQLKLNQTYYYNIIFTNVTSDGASPDPDFDPNPTCTPASSTTWCSFILKNFANL